MNRSRFALHLLSLCCLTLPLAAQEPLKWHGVELVLPTGWTSEAVEEITLLKPPGWSRDVETGEAYGLLFDDETKDLTAPDLGDTIDAAAEELLPGSTRAGDPTIGKLGALDAHTFVYKLRNDNGQFTLRIDVFAGKDGTAALFAAGKDQKLTARTKEVQALRESLAPEGAARPKKRAFGMGKKETPPEPKPTPAPGGEEPAPPTDNPLARGRKPNEPKTDDGGGDNPLAKGPRHQRIAGGREVTFQSVAIDVPKGWRVETGEDGTQLLLPPGFGESGVVEELCALCGDGSLKSLGAEDALEKIQEGLDELQPGLTLQGQPKAGQFGDLAGKTFVFTGQNEAGQAVEARLHAFDTEGGVFALLALGFPEKLKSRAGDLGAMLASLRKAGGAKGGAGGNPRELCGQWIWLSNVNANNGGGRSSQSSLVLNADGSYTYSGEVVSTNPEGAAWGSENDAGRWSLQGTTMVFQSQSGEVVRHRLEKRNHPKNNDPMIVLDGKTFVTATQRAPW